MGKNIKVFLIGFIIISYLSACAANSSGSDSNEMSNEQLSLRIAELNDMTITLQEQTNSLIDRINEPEIINPINFDGEQLYVNNMMPLAILIPNDFDLPIVVYKYDTSIVIFFENENIVQFIEGYTIVPSIIVKDNNDNPDYYDKKDIVKNVDENWVIIKNISIETSLDEQTNQKIKEMLENIKFY